MTVPVQQPNQERDSSYMQLPTEQETGWSGDGWLERGWQDGRSVKLTEDLKLEKIGRDR